MDVISKIKYTLEKRSTIINMWKPALIRRSWKDQDGRRDQYPGYGEQGNQYAVDGRTCFAGGLLIYLFIFIYGAMVMRGVLEEKTSRIVEVVISFGPAFPVNDGQDHRSSPWWA